MLGVGLEAEEKKMDVINKTLIIHKIFANRPRDIEDVRGILLKNVDIDIQYIRRWLTEFDKSVTGSSFLRTFEELLDLVRSR